MPSMKKLGVPLPDVDGNCKAANELPPNSPVTTAKWPDPGADEIPQVPAEKP